MSRYNRRPPTSNASSSTNQTLIRYRPSDNDFDEERKHSSARIAGDIRPDPIYSSPHDIHDLFEDPTHRRNESVGVTIDNNDPYDFEPSPSQQHLTASILGDLAHNNEITRYPPSGERKESRYSETKETASTAITIPKSQPVSTTASTVRKPSQAAPTPITPSKQPKQSPPTVTYSDSSRSDASSSESESESESPSESPSESSSGNSRRPRINNTADSDSLIIPLPNETKSQKKERKKAEKAEIENLVKKNRKKVIKMVRCCLLPIAAISLLKKAIEALI